MNEPEEIHREASVDPPPGGSLRRKAASGVVALLSRQVVGILIEVPAGIVVARLLAPEDFGLYAITHFIVALLGQSLSLGLGAWLIQKDTPPSQEELATVYTVQLILCSTALVAIWLMAPVLMAWYGRPDAASAALMRAMGVSVFMIAFRTVPLSVLERKVEYTKVAWSEFSGSMVFQVIAVTLSALGFGVWSLVTALLGNSAVVTALLLWYSGWRPALGLRWDVLRHALSFGTSVQLFSWINFAKDSLIPTIVAVRFGPTAVGHLNMALGIAQRPAFLMPTLQRVSFSTFARLKGDPAQLQRAVEYTLFVAVLTVAPLAAILGGLAHPLIGIVYGEKWLPSVPALRWFCAAVISGSISWIAFSTLFALGRATVATRIVTAWTITLWALAYYFTDRWGFTGIAVVVFATTGFGIWTIYETKRLVPVRVFRTIGTVLLVSGGVGALGALIAASARITLPALVLLLLGLVALAYAAIAVLNPGRVLACLTDLRRATNIAHAPGLDRLLGGWERRQAAAAERTQGRTWSGP